MEECEALCTRVGVMVRGRLRCLGGLQHLKSKFGSGYLVELTCIASVDGRRALLESLQAIGGAFSNAQLVDDNGARVKLALPVVAQASPSWVSGDGATSLCYLANIFEGLAAHAERLGITEYAATQATLESVFLAIVHATEHATIDENEVPS